MRKENTMAYKTINKVFKKSTNLMKAALDAANKKASENIKNSGNNKTSYIAARNNANNYYPVRNIMKSMGLDNSKIGWQDGYVTYNNVKFKPSYVTDGVSYAPISDIQNFVNQSYKTNGIDPVRVTDYVSPAGLGGISYSKNGVVSAAGTNIPILYMDGDRAVVDRNNLDAAMKKARQNANIRTSEELQNQWDSIYNQRLNDAYLNMVNYKNFRYMPESDPVYLAYKDAYEREGKRAYRDAAAKLSSRNYGNMTSAAQTLANQQLNYYMNQLADRVPELAENAYERYKAGYDMERQNYQDLVNMSESWWKKNLELNDLAKKDYDKSLSNERERTLQSYEDMDNELKREQTKRENNQAIIDYIFTNAERRGRFTREEAELLNIPKKQNGEYMTPSEIKLQYDIQYLYDIEMPKISYEEGQKRVTNRQKLQQSLNNDIALEAYKASLEEW